jgi:choline dehydrogenase-like flavoprotein
VILPTAGNILSDAAETELNPAILTDPKQAGDVEQRPPFTPNRTIVTSAHMQATNKIGSVVTSDLRVIGAESLCVVDVSVFPASIGANPMQSIYTLAKIFADARR